MDAFTLTCLQYASVDVVNKLMHNSSGHFVSLRTANVSDNNYAVPLNTHRHRYTERMKNFNFHSDLASMRSVLRRVLREVDQHGVHARRPRIVSKHPASTWRCPGTP